MSSTKLSDKQWEAWQQLEDPEVIEAFAGGGAGGGKSYLGCLRQVYRRTKYPGTRGFIGRENFTGLRDSTMKTYFGLVSHMGYSSIDHFTYNAQEHTAYWKNGTAEFPGSEQHFRHMAYMPSDPDYNRFGSTEYTDAFVDEAPEVAPRACQVLLSRLRYMHTRYGIGPEILYTGNPGESWIKAEFVMDNEGKMVDLPRHRARVLFTIHDNPDELLRNQYIKTLEKLDPYDRARLLYGDWSAQPKVERPFAFAFDRSRHVKPCTLIKGVPVIISIDFNLDPFCAIIAQEQGKRFAITNEIAISSGTIEELCTRILAIVPDVHMHKYTGDRSGASRRIQTKSTASMWEDFLKVMRARMSQLDLPANPSHKQSREDTNYVLHHHPEFVVDPSCAGVIFDLTNVEVDDDHSIIKQDRSKSAQRADYLDCFVGSTLVETYDGAKAISDIVPGDMVRTSTGWSAVTDQWSKGVADVVEYTFDDGTTITCTPDHLFYVQGIGWTAIRDVYLHKHPTCSLRPLSIEGYPTESTQSRSITTATNDTEGTHEAYTDKCGLMPMGQSQKDGKSTTSTMIVRTIALKTWQLLSGWLMRVCMAKNDRRKTPTGSRGLRQKEGSTPRHGTQVNKASHGIRSTQSGSTSETSSSVSAIAQCAGLHSPRKLQGSDFAATIASQSIEGKRVLIQSKEAATSVALDFTPTSTHRHVTVPCHAADSHTGPRVKSAKPMGRQMVYDITVEGASEFYANGILVHNCVRYTANTYLRRWIEQHRRHNVLQPLSSGMAARPLR